MASILTALATICIAAGGAFAPIILIIHGFVEQLASETFYHAVAPAFFLGAGLTGFAVYEVFYPALIAVHPALTFSSLGFSSIIIEIVR